MKAKSTLIIACLAVAMVMTFGVANAQAQCCFGNIIAAPFYAAGAVVVGAVEVVGGAASLVASAVAAPFSCGACTVCAPCAAPPVSCVPCAMPPVSFCPGFCG